MSSVIKDKREMSESSSDAQFPEYIQIKGKKLIESFLHKEKNPYKDDRKEITKEEQPKKEQQKIPVKKAQKGGLKFIKDDRERIYPQQKLQAKDTQDQLERKNQKKPKYQQKKYETEEDRQIDKVKYAQKDQKPAQVPRYMPRKQKRQTEDIKQRPKEIYKQSNPGKSLKRQQQFKNGEEITVQLIEDLPEYQNQICINSKYDSEGYVREAKKLLRKYDYIVLVAFGHFVEKAILVAGFLAQDQPHLKQINIPKTIKVNEINPRLTRQVTRGLIYIELSLGTLNEQHMGYQESQQPNQARSQLTNPKKSKEQNPKSSKKPLYKEKQEKKVKKEQQPDERQLR